MATSAYKLVAPSDDTWLSPEEITDRLEEGFAGIYVDAMAAQEEARQFIEAYTRLLSAGLPDSSAPPLSQVESQWSGAVQVWIWESNEGDPGIYLTAMNRAPINVGFTKSFQSRRRRAMADRIAKLLGYEVESCEND